MIGFTCSAVAIQMLVELGVKNPLGERLLQFVNQTIFIEHVFRIASGQKLVKQVFLDCHMMLHPFSSSWPHTQDSGQSRRTGSYMRITPCAQGQAPHANPCCCSKPVHGPSTKPAPACSAR